jgi:biopolymer transport protein ExbD
MRSPGTNPRPPVSKNGMDLNRLRSILAAPIAALFLIMVLSVFGVQRPASVGFRIPMIRVHNQSRNDCFEPNRIVYFRLARDGTVWLNSTEIPSDQLTAITKVVMENRGDRILEVVADPHVSYGQVVDFLDKIAAAKMVLHVALLTDQLRVGLEEDHMGTYCGLEWPANEFSSTPTSFYPAPQLWH